MDRLNKELKDIKPTYEQFLNNFMDVSYGGGDKKIGLVKYILSKINEIYETGEHSLDLNKVNIEHFLPKNPRTSWKVSAQDIKEFVNLLGNLTILHESINRRAGNKGPKEKYEELKKSQIPLTKEMIKKVIGKNFKWGKEEIEERQKELAKISFEKVWNY